MADPEIKFRMSKCPGRAPNSGICLLIVSVNPHEPFKPCAPENCMFADCIVEGS